MFEFKEFGKIPRLNREVVVTEKLDGTNACVVVYRTKDTDEIRIGAQSRSRLITPESDNYGFARWVYDNSESLKELGEGYHYGEWWGQGINRNYGLQSKRFSLFNVRRWGEKRPACCEVVPILGTGIGFTIVEKCLQQLMHGGSVAVPGFSAPEGIVAFHTQGNFLFKVTLEKDHEPKNNNETARPRRGPESAKVS